MDFHVLIRETLDWDCATHEDLKSDFIRQVVRQWDSALHVTYMDCRARLKAITIDSLKRLSPVHIHEYGSFDVSVVQPDDVLLICDDDDWYHPGIVEHLRDYLRAHGWLQYHLILWPDGVFNCRLRRDGPPRPIPKRALDTGRHVIRTNSYAVAGSFLCSDPERLSVVLRHGHADHYLKSTAPPVIRLTTPLSLVNKHPCSQVMLQRQVGARDAAEWGSVFRELAQKYIQRPTLQPLFPWAHGYISRAKTVFSQALGV